MIKLRLYIIFFLTIGFAYSETYELRWSDPVNIISINTPANEFAPSWNNFTKELYFNSDRGKKTNFYLASLDEKNSFSSFLLAKNGLNSNSDNNSYISFLNANEALVSSFKQYSRRSYQNIFQTFEKRKEWTDPVFIESLGFEGFVSHPTLSPNGKIIVYSTTKDSRQKDLDLWIAYRQDNGTYINNSPIKELNTNGDEITPFLVSEDTLFFASNGQEGPGGFDIFYSIQKEGIWTQPIPVSSLNTKFDESDFTLLPNGISIFASNRPGGKGNLDLYQSSMTIHKLGKKLVNSDIELSIASQVGSIRLGYDIVYKTFFINPYILQSEEELYAFAYSMKFLKNDTQNIKPNIDSVILNTFNIIGSRLKDNYSSLLTIKTNKLYEVNFAERIKEYFEKAWEISGSRILIQKEDLDKTIYISFESNDKTILSPINIGTNEFSFEPKMLEVLLNARPVNMIKSWNFNLFTNNSILLDQGRSLPFQMNLDLHKYRYDLLNLDSLTLVLNTEDLDGKIYNEKSVINLTQSESRRKTLIQINNKYYEELTIFHPQHFIKESDYTATILNFINDNTKLNNPIKLIYYSQTQKGIVDNFQSLFEEKLSNKKFKIVTELIDPTNKKDFNKDLAPFLFSILIEKGDF